MPQVLTDEAIIAGLRDAANTRQAFDQLYRQIYPAVRQQVVRFGGNEDDARDIFQEGVLALWKNVREGRYELRAEVKLSTYLIEICKRRWIDMQKKASRRYERTLPVLPEVKEEPGFLTDWIDREDQAAFQARFGQLGQRCQDLLLRFYYERQPLREIAGVLGIGEASAKNEKYRCMQRLKQIFQA